MPPMGGATLTPAQVSAVAAYIWGRSPLAPRAAGRTPEGQRDDQHAGEGRHRYRRVGRHRPRGGATTGPIMPLGPIADGDLCAFDRIISTNLRGTFIVLSRAARSVATGGRIVALSSSVVAKSLPGYGAYIASKAGVEGLVRVLANEPRGRQITVNAVAPGPVGTELFLKGKTEAQIERFRTLAPLERFGRPEEIAEVVSFLAGPSGGWINGQVLRANGGFA